MKIRFIIVFLLLISCTSVDKSSEDNAVTEENIDRDQELIYGEMMFHVSSVAALLNEIKGLGLELMYDKEYLLCTTVDDNDPEYCNSQGIYWDCSNYPEPLN